MTVAAAKRAGIAVAVPGMSRWNAHCEVCNWTHFSLQYKGDAAKVARLHNAVHHPEAK